MVPKYSPRAARAIGLLKRSYNDVEVYVEDKSCRNLYTALFGRMLGGEIRLRSVNQVGGRESVLAACRLDQAYDGRKRLYLIDGDLDLILGRGKPRLRHLHRLNSYSIENVVLAPQAIQQVGLIAATNRERDEIRRFLELPGLVENLSRRFAVLFVLYAIARECVPGLQTVKYPVHKLAPHGRSGHSPKGELIRAREREVARAIRRAVGVAGLRLRTSEMRGRIKEGDWVRFVSGKDYLFPVVYSRLRVLGYGGTQDSLRVALATYYEPNTDRSLFRRVRQLAPSPVQD